MPNDIRTRAVATRLHVQPDTLSLIDAAAVIHGKTRADFIIDAAHGAAEAALLDQPANGPGVARLLNARRPWEQ